MEIRRTDAEAVGNARREVLDEDVGAGHHLPEQFAAFFCLEIKRDRLLVGVQHRERKGSPSHVAAAAQMLAMVRLDLDHVSARHRHQKGGVGPVVYMREIEDRDARKRVTRVRFARRRW